MALDFFEMADQIEFALGEEWRREKRVLLPAGGVDDRRILFRAIARGVLQYLEDKQSEMFVTIRLRNQTSGNVRDYDVQALDFNKAANPPVP